MPTSREPQAPDDVRGASVPTLVSGIVSDTGDLVGAHLASVKHELGQGLVELRERTRAAVIAVGAGVAASVALILALGSTLIALGLPAWAAYWIVTGIVAIVIAVMARRAARRRTGPAAGDPGAAVERATKDAAWIAGRAGDAVT